MTGQHAENLIDCPGCGAAPGSVHTDGCTWAMCPDCGGELPHSRCRARPAERARPPSRPSLWHGTIPGCDLAAELGWDNTDPNAGADALVNEAMRLGVRIQTAIALGMFVWDPAEQRYRAGEVDERVLDLHMSGPMDGIDPLADVRDVINVAAPNPSDPTAGNTLDKVDDLLDQYRDTLDALERGQDGDGPKREAP
ncbi:hypothetical protein JNUCC0626_50245 (plasmid) [Lentzea sp. JNUCC 0626]|uniref:hypothetical protein n=1 Tax=Lentzea sp. JNUCC 0626 TaxID=3367513 RepID=UPI003747C91D